MAQGGLIRCRLQNIFKAYEVQFQPVQNEYYWSTCIGPNLMYDPHTRHNKQGRRTTTRIHNKMDQSLLNKPKK